MAYYTFLILIIALMSKSKTQKCLLKASDVCVFCQDNTRLYQGSCFLNIPYCNDYRYGIVCVSCIDGFQLKENNACQAEFGLNSKNATQIISEQNQTKNKNKENIVKNRTRKQVKRIYNDLPIDGWRQIDQQQYFQSWVALYKIISFEPIQYFQQNIEPREIYYIKFRQAFYYRMLFIIVENGGLYQTVIQKSQPSNITQLYYYRYFFPSPTQTKIQQYYSQDKVNRLVDNVERLYPEKSQLRPYYFYQSTNNEGLAIFRTIFFSQDVGLSQLVFNQTDFSRPGQVEKFTKLQSFGDRVQDMYQIIYQKYGMRNSVAGAQLEAIIKQTKDENHTTYNFTFRSLDPLLRFDPKRIVAIIGVQVQKGIVERITKNYLKEPQGDNIKQISYTVQCAFNYSKAQIQPQRYFNVDYIVSDVDQKMFTRIKDIIQCVVGFGAIINKTEVLQMGKTGNKTHQFYEILIRNQSQPYVNTYYTFSYDITSDFISLVDYYYYNRSKYTAYYFTNNDILHAQYSQKLNDKYVKDLKNIVNQNNVVLVSEYTMIGQLSGAEINKRYHFRATIKSQYRSQVMNQYEFVEMVYQMQIGTAQFPKYFVDRLNLIRIRKYKKEIYVLADPRKYSLVFQSYSKYFENTQYISFNMGMVYQSKYRPFTTRFTCQVTEYNPKKQIRLFHYEMQLSGWEGPLAILPQLGNLTNMDNCYPYRTCQQFDSFLTFDQIFKNRQMSNYLRLSQSQMIENTQNLNFGYMRVKNKKQNDVIYEVGYGDQATLAGYLIDINTTQSQGLFLFNAGGRSVTFGYRIFEKLPTIYDMPRRSSKRQLKTANINKRILKQVEKRFPVQFNMFQIMQTTRLQGIQQNNIQFNETSLKITIKNYQLQFSNTSNITFIRPGFYQCMSSSFQYDIDMLKQFVRSVIGPSLQFNYFKLLDSTCISYMAVGYQRVKIVFNRTSKLYNLRQIQMLEVFVFQRVVREEVMYPLSYSSNYQMNVNPDDKLGTIQPASLQTQQYIKKIYTDIVTALYQRKYRISKIKMVVCDSPAGKFRMLVDMDLDIRYQIKFLESLTTEYKPPELTNKLITDEALQYLYIYIINYFKPMLPDLLQNFSKQAKVIHTSFYERNSINHTTFVVQNQYLVFFVTILCAPDNDLGNIFKKNNCNPFQMEVYFNDIGQRKKKLREQVQQNVSKVTQMQEWKACQRQLKTFYGHFMTNAKIIDINKTEIHGFIFFKARYNSSAGILDVEVSFNLLNNLTIIHSITPAVGTPLMSMEGCKISNPSMYGKCKQCFPDYFLQSDSICTKKIGNCKIQSGKICLYCQTGYVRIQIDSFLSREPYKCE